MPSHIRLGVPGAELQETGHGPWLSSFLSDWTCTRTAISIAVCELGREAAPFAGTIRHDVLTLLKVLRKYGEAAQVSVVYEAGLTGYGLYRELTGHG